MSIIAFFLGDRGNNLIRRINLANGMVTTVAGSLSGTVGTLGSTNFGHSDGIGTAASFYHPCGLTMDAAATFVLIVSEEEEGEPSDAVIP